MCKTCRKLVELFGMVALYIYGIVTLLYVFTNLILNIIMLIMIND